MDPFILSRNAFHIYCSEYVNNNNNQSIIDINQRYEYFLQTLERLRTSFEQTSKNHNSNNEKDTLTISSGISQKKHLDKSNKRRMPKIYITVSCSEHLTQKQPNIKIK